MIPEEKLAIRVAFSSGKKNSPSSFSRPGVPWAWAQRRYSGGEHCGRNCPADMPAITTQVPSLVSRRGRRPFGSASGRYGLALAGPNAHLARCVMGGGHGGGEGRV